MYRLTVADRSRYNATTRSLAAIMYRIYRHSELEEVLFYMQWGRRSQYHRTSRELDRVLYELAASPMPVQEKYISVGIECIWKVLTIDTACGLVMQSARSLVSHDSHRPCI